MKFAMPLSDIFVVKIVSKSELPEVWPLIVRVSVLTMMAALVCEEVRLRRKVEMMSDFSFGGVDRGICGFLMWIVNWMCFCGC